MKNIIITIISIIVLGCIITCNKSSSTPKTTPVPVCTTCSTGLVEHKTDSTGFYYFLPTAFTPNGDGKNDVFRVVYSMLNADSSNLTIWDANNNGVYTGDLTQSWNGYDLTGAKCAAGKYFVYMRLVTTGGVVITACTCVTILQYKGNCIYTGGVTYYLADELDPVNGFVNPTNENLCP